VAFSGSNGYVFSFDLGMNGHVVFTGFSDKAVSFNFPDNAGVVTA
jgi:hypothetical protein